MGASSSARIPSRDCSDSAYRADSNSTYSSEVLEDPDAPSEVLGERARQVVVGQPFDVWG